MGNNTNNDPGKIYKDKATELLPLLNGFKIFDAKHILN